MFALTRRDILVCLSLLACFTSDLDGLGADNDKSSNLPIEPEGVYSFLNSPLDQRDAAVIRKSLPLKKISLQIWGPPDLLKLKPGVNFRVVFYRDGSAEYLGLSGVEKIGTYKGTVSLHQYGRLCLLLDAFMNGENQNAKFGKEANVSHPVMSELTFEEREVVKQFRNDMNFGDFRFWVLESAILRTCHDIKWARAEKAEQTDSTPRAE